MRRVVFFFCITVPSLAFAGLDEGLAALNKEDYLTAMKELEPLAQQGNAEAEFRVGRMFEEGSGTAKDNKQAMAWYLKAARQGHAAAQ